MDDYILLFLLILVICIFLYVYNNQHLYNMNDCIINNYKKNNYKKNKKTNKNLDDYTNLTYVDKFMNSNNKIEDFNNIDVDNIKLIINEEEVDNINKIFFLNNNDSTYNIKIVFNVIISEDLFNKFKIKIDGEKKSDFKKLIVKASSGSNIIEDNIDLNPATFYNLNILQNNRNIKSFQFETGHKLFNYGSDNYNDLLLKLNYKTITQHGNKSKDFSSENSNNDIGNTSNNNDIGNTSNNNNESGDIIYNSKNQCQNKLKNIFKGIELDNKTYIDLGEIEMKPFNLVNFMIELPDFNTYLQSYFDSPDSSNIYGYLKDFIPHRFEIDDLYILNDDDKCPIVFIDNKYTIPKIEPMNIVQGLNKYLLTIKYIEDEYYDKTVKYLVKLKLIYQNLNESKLVERETLPLVFSFTINKQSSIKNNLINKNLKFTENLEYKNKLKNKFINKQKEQDENLLEHQQELNSLLNDVKYEYEKNFN